jgi:hypothetical protein
MMRDAPICLSVTRQLSRSLRAERSNPHPRYALPRKQAAEPDQPSHRLRHFHGIVVRAGAMVDCDGDCHVASL